MMRRREIARLVGNVSRESFSIHLHISAISTNVEKMSIQHEVKLFDFIEVKYLASEVSEKKCFNYFSRVSTKKCFNYFSQVSTNEECKFFQGIDTSPIFLKIMYAGSEVGSFQHYI